MATRQSFNIKMLSMALLLAMLLSAAGIGGIGSIAQAAETTAIEGTISVIEVDGTVAIGADSGQAVVVYVRDDTRIFRDGKPAQLKDLQKGDRVTAKYASDRSLIEIRANPPEGSSRGETLEGRITLKEVDGTLVISAAAENKAMVVYAVDGTRIFLNGNRSGLEYLDRGDWVRAEVGPDRHLTELRVFTYDPRKPGNVSVINGIVSAKMMSGTVAIAEKGTAIAVHLTDDSQITRNGRPASLKDIRKGDRVWAKYGPDRGLLELRILDS